MITLYYTLSIIDPTGCETMYQKAFKTIQPANVIAIGNEIYVYEYTHREHVFPMHWHDFYEFELILDGTGEMVCNDKTYTIKPGMVSFVTPLDFHEIHMKSKVHEICIQFSSESISKEILTLFHNMENNIIYFGEEQIKRTLSLFNLLRDNTINGMLGPMYLSHVLETILISFKAEVKTIPTKHEYSSTPVQKALVYIHSHFRENPKMSDVANMLYLNENYFCALFKKHVGENYKDYLRKLKLNRAKKLITDTDILLTQIAFECGYTSQSNFNRDFKKCFDVSPSEMRENKNI